jgi:hypothetical protein
VGLVCLTFLGGAPAVSSVPAVRVPIVGNIPFPPVLGDPAVVGGHVVQFSLVLLSACYCCNSFCL